MRITFRILPGIVLLALFVSTSRAASLSANLVDNGDFSQVMDGKPVGWVAEGDSSRVNQSLSVVRQRGVSCAKLDCKSIQGSGGDIHSMIAQMSVVSLERGKTYQLTCDVREEGLRGRSVSVAVMDMTDWNTCGLNTSIPVTGEWRHISIIFQATTTVSKESRLQFWFTEPGTFYLRDVKLMEIPPIRMVFTDIAPRTESKNFVTNGAFDVGTFGWSSLGRTSGWGNIAHLHGTVMASDDPLHAHFLRIPLGGRNTPVLYFDYLIPSATRQLRMLAANLGWITVQPDTLYTLSCEMRSNPAGLRAALGVMATNPSDGSGNWRDVETHVILSNRWKRYVFTFQAPKRYLFVAIGPDLEIELNGDVDITNIQLERGGQATAYAPSSKVEIGVTPSQMGGLFTSGEKAMILVRGCNHASREAHVKIAMQATDFFARLHPLPSITMGLPPGKAVQESLTLPANWNGYYRITAKWVIDGKPFSHSIRIAILPKGVPNDSVVGMNHAFSDDALIRLAKMAGVTWYRDWSIKWQDMEPEPGIWHWEVADTQIHRVLAQKANLMALLPPFPSANWSSEAPVNFPQAGPGSRLRQAWAPKDPALLDEFIHRAVERYKEKVKYWEFLNEPIYTDYSLPGSGVGGYPGRSYTVEDYVNLLRGAAAAMRSADPQCKVIGGVASDPDRFMTQLMNDGILKVVDILNLHIYPGLRAPEGYEKEMDHLLSLMKEHGGIKPIWITEFAYYGSDNLPRKPFIPQPYSWEDSRLLASERQCADYTIRFFTIMMARGVRKFFIHAGVSGTVNTPELECPIFAGEGAPRKLLPALAVFAKMVGTHPRPVLHETLKGGCRVAAFHTNGKSLLILWNPTSARTSLSISFPQVKAYDIMEEPLNPKRLTPSDDPIYVEGKGDSAAAMAKAIMVIK